MAEQLNKKARRLSRSLYRCFRGARRAASPRDRLRLRLEVLEERCLPSTGAFLQGYAFAGGSAFQSGSGLAGATITLYASDGTTQIKQTTTDASGYYRFDDSNVPGGLGAGTYFLVETVAPTGYAGSSVDIRTEVDPASATTLGGRKAIEVTIVDPSNLQTNWPSANPPPPNRGPGYGPGNNDDPSYFGSPLGTGFAGQFNIYLTDPGNPGYRSPPGSGTLFSTYCVDLNDSLQNAPPDPDTFAVLPTPAVTGLPNGDEIAYLYNHYGAGPNSFNPSDANVAATNDQAEGLQEAMWKLEYGANFTPDFHGSVAVQNAYNFYLADAAGKSEAAVYLDATLGGTRSNLTSAQGMIASGSFNFSNLTQPAIATTTGGTVTLGSGTKLTDSATLSAGSNPTGTITFNLYAAADTNQQHPLDTEAVTVNNGNSTYSTPDGYLPTAAGTYYWVASYGGDTNNNTVSGGPTDEAEVVNPAQPALNTQASSNAQLGTGATTISDNATLSGAYTPTGSIAFTLMLGSSTVYTTSDPVTGNGPYTASYTLPTTGTVAGTYTWHATYTSGDGNNLTASDQGGAAEQTAVSPAQPGLDTQASQAVTLTAGPAPTISDTATLSGGYNPTGSIAFTLKLGNTTVYTTSDTVTGNGPYTASYTLPTSGTVTGTYTWHATYTSADGNNLTASDQGGTAEQTAVSPAQPGLDTQASQAVTLSAGPAPTITDTATLSGGYNPTGSIAFTLMLGSSTVYTTSDPVTGNGPYTASYTLPTTGTVAGTYTWHATYTSGDGNNLTASDQGGTAEQTAVSPAKPTIVTTPGGTVNLANVSISGTKFMDQTGNGFSADDGPQAGVTINLYQESNGTPGLQTGSCGDALVATTTTAGDGTYSFTNLAPGTYYVQESVPSGYIQTGGGPNGSAGNTYYTIVASSGRSYSGYNFDDYQIPTCVHTNVSFKVTTPGGCSTTVTDLAGNTLQGDTVTATFTVPAGTKPEQLTLVSYVAPGPSFSNATAYQQVIYQPGGLATGTFGPGTYSLTVKIPNSYYQIDFVCGAAIDQLEPNQNGNAYGPDSANILYHPQNRLISSDGGGCNAANPVPAPVSRTTPPPTSAPAAGGALTDSATLANGYHPTGSITFYLFAPGVTPNSNNSNNVYSNTVAVNGNGVYDTSTGTNPGGYVPSSGGTYQWVAVYNNGPNNTGVSSNFGDEPQKVVGLGSISGQKFIDLTGNGLTSDDTPQGGVTINLYRNSVSSGNLAASMATLASNGSYQFGNLAAGTYVVQESVPAGYVQTAPFPSTYTVNLAAGVNVTGENFADFQKCPPGVVSCISYQVTHNGCTTTYSSLAGHTHPGDTVKVTFTIASGVTHDVTLVSYNAPTPVFDATVAYKQTIYQQATGTWTGGTHCLTVKVPSCDYQIDFVCGPAIDKFGPAGSNIFYSAQARLFSADNGGPGYNADVTAAGLAYIPAQVRTAYDLNNLALDGTGQTIAIVDAYDNPAIFQTVDTFDAQFGAAASGPTLLDQYGPASSFLTVLGQDGTATLPDTDPAGVGNNNWEVETALDVEWIHAVAPGAKIVLVEANTDSLPDLMAGVGTAARLPGVSVVSMSWGFAEGQAVLAADEAQYDSVLTTPTGHQGVTFVASTGDYGSADPEYPAFSPNVLAVGGTSLLLNADNSYGSETGWGGISGSQGVFIGTGGGISMFEPQPSYQSAVQSTGFRTTPDVSLVADPNTGVWLADTYNLPGGQPWEIVGGTSLSAPSWAGLVALVNQGRVAAGGQTLNSVATNETQQALYSLPQADFNVIAGGTNGGFNAQPGYNLVTGLGSPIGNLLVPDLVAYQWSADSVASNTAGVHALDPANAIPNANFAMGSGGITNAVFNVFNVEIAGLPGTEPPRFSGRGPLTLRPDAAPLPTARPTAGRLDAALLPPAAGLPPALAAGLSLSQAAVAPPPGVFAPANVSGLRFAAEPVFTTAAPNSGDEALAAIAGTLGTAPEPGDTISPARTEFFFDGAQFPAFRPAGEGIDLLWGRAEPANRRATPATPGDERLEQAADSKTTRPDVRNATATPASGKIALPRAAGAGVSWGLATPPRRNAAWAALATVLLAVPGLASRAPEDDGRRIDVSGGPKRT